MNSDERLARQLWAIGDDVRIRLLRLLPASPDCEHGNNVSRLAAELGLSQPTVSHHLRVLRQAGLVSHRKMCRDVYYWVDADGAQDVVERLRAVLLTTPPVAPEPARAPARKRAAAPARRAKRVAAPQGA